MKKFMSGLCAAALMATTLITGTAPASAQFGEAIREGRIPPGNYIDNFDGRRIYRGNREGLREFRGDRREFRRDRREFRRDRREARRDFYRDGGYSYYRGHRGYSRYRPGYREYNGLWFPLAAFAAGAVISGAINSQPVYRGGGDHVEWCRDRYRSYRIRDNSFQPYNGPRQQCYSPYS